MKKLIVAITVSFMMLGLMTGCGAEKNFDGDILEVISFDMSKPEILENAEKEFGEIDGMGGRDKELVEDPMDAMYLDYRLDSLYGYKGKVLLTFDYNLRTLERIGIFYLEIEAETAEQQYEKILDQLSNIYGEFHKNEYGNYVIGTGVYRIEASMYNYKIEGQEGVYTSIDIYIYPEEDN